jgi:DNA-binding response OmpR family regulator
MSKKILIVDDHSEIRSMIQITLGKGFEMLEAEEGTTALAITRRVHPDMVVLDVMMPGELDGFQVLEAIKGDPDLKDIFVIMVTARGQASDYEMGMASGADGYFIKPFSPLQLTNTIKELMK